MNRILFFAFNVLVIGIGCTSFKNTSQHSMAQQGIEGHVYRIAGNQMPSPDRKPSAPKGIRTTLYIFQLTNIKQVNRVGQSAFYSEVHTKLITKVETDSDGYFKINLDPGNYSLFSKKDNLYFANMFDKDNNIVPVKVLAGKMAKVDFTVDYDAVY